MCVDRNVLNRPSDAQVAEPSDRAGVLEHVLGQLLEQAKVNEERGGGGGGGCILACRSSRLVH